jgi:uncharacterized damage-inducible protein DinB
MITARNQFVAKLSAADSQQDIAAVFSSSPPMHFALVETLLQLCGHGTHHRAQLVNMLRRNGLQATGIDYIIWRRELKDMS